MKIDYTGLEKRQPDLLPAARDASKLLETELGVSSSLVRADWDVRSDANGEPLVSLAISDWTGSVAYNFKPEELSKSDHMKIRLHRLWGDLLSVQSHAQLDRMNWRLHYAGDDRT